MQQVSVDLAGAGPIPTKKFGTLLGVYTPSVLTILGVIMYQRFGWVVGHAGLGRALLIVLLAHVISVTTGLSVASIATNHTVKTGGNYYIISRSLGLSIGGAIGVALYLALTLGVSLYLIGFAEAFLAAVPASPTGDPKNDIRLVGTVACVAISLLTLYSTDFALKSQLFVLGAIALSLVSIAAGAVIPIGPGETPVGMGPPADALPFEAVFAVFFPAVTGFTAGVGMSGDLKDPKRSIPIGTMAAIFTGMVIYLVLPPFLAAAASVEQLQADKNILLRVAAVPELVTLGVFSATISSALGSILGAPRTLQALAFDGIVPRVLGRGRDEPRIALLVTILIAEGGILVGELEIVGAVISMFFLTSYGFLCLACGLERWASPDFRPQFRVPIWVSLIGAVASFVVMAQIDVLAMMGAISLMAAFYFVLKRRQLVLGSGDTWGGVWSAVVRWGLMRLRASASRAHTRNWRPNMVVMSRSQYRGPTIEFARGIVGDRGILTHFDLIPGTSIRATVDENLEREYPGMFARRQGAEDVYEAIPNLAANFGLAGMETNTILIGWPRRPEANTRYGEMVGRLVKLDLSVLMLRLDTERGFGKKQQIDIWWDGVASTGQLMLTLAYLLTSEASWKNANVRVLVNARPNADPAAAQKRLQRIISQARVRAEAVLLAPLATDLGDRIRQESAHADLVMVHALAGDDPSHFVAVNQPVLKGLGTALLVRPAPVFDDPYTVFPEGQGALQTVDVSPRTLTLSSPPAPALAPVVERLEHRVREAYDRFIKAVDAPAVDEERAFLASTVREVEDLRQVERRLVRRGGRIDTARGLIEWARNRFATAILDRNQNFMTTASRGRDDAAELAWTRRLRDGLSRLREDLQAALQEVPMTVAVATVADDWATLPQDDLRTRLKKTRVRFAMRWFRRPPPPRRVATRRVAIKHLGPSLWSSLSTTVEEEGVRRLDALNRIRRLSADVDRCFGNLTVELERLNDSGSLPEFRRTWLARSPDCRTSRPASRTATGKANRNRNLTCRTCSPTRRNRLRTTSDGSISNGWRVGGRRPRPKDPSSGDFGAGEPAVPMGRASRGDGRRPRSRPSSFRPGRRRSTGAVPARRPRSAGARAGSARGARDGGSADARRRRSGTQARGGAARDRGRARRIERRAGLRGGQGGDRRYGTAGVPRDRRRTPRDVGGALSAREPGAGRSAGQRARAGRGAHAAHRDDDGRGRDGRRARGATGGRAGELSGRDGWYRPISTSAWCSLRETIVTDLPARVESAQEVLVDAVRLVAFELEQAAGAAETEAGFEEEPAGRRRADRGDRSQGGATRCGG